jgi:hypothetical protein
MGTNRISTVTSYSLSNRDRYEWGKIEIELRVLRDGQIHRVGELDVAEVTGLGGADEWGQAPRLSGYGAKTVKPVPVRRDRRIVNLLQYCNPGPGNRDASGSDGAGYDVCKPR